jgi:hypothetical protein
MNAAERLWRGLARRDWEAVRAQFHPAAMVERPGDRTRVGVEEFIALHRSARARDDARVEVLRSLVDGTTAVVEATAGPARCAGFYDLHQGRIAGATEYWTAGP